MRFYPFPYSWNKSRRFEIQGFHSWHGAVLKLKIPETMQYIGSEIPAGLLANSPETSGMRPCVGSYMPIIGIGRTSLQTDYKNPQTCLPAFRTSKP